MDLFDLSVRAPRRSSQTKLFQAFRLMAARDDGARKNKTKKQNNNNKNTARIKRCLNLQSNVKDNSTHSTALRHSGKMSAHAPQICDSLRSMRTHFAAVSIRA